MYAVDKIAGRQEWNIVAGITRYERSLRARLRNSGQWPEFERPDFLDRLDRVAERALAKRTVEGYLAAILIYHQLVEEMLKLLTQDGHFIVQAAILPWRIDFHIPHKSMFGQAVQRLRDSVDFRDKHRLLALADEINTIRIDIVHRLTRRGALAGLGRDAGKARRLYDRIFAMFDEAHDEFRVQLSSFRKDLA